MLAALGAVVLTAMIIAALFADDPDAAIQLAVLYIVIAVWDTWGFSLFGAADNILRFGGF